MTPERWRQVDGLFDAALRLDPAEREPWLRRACDDEDLRAEVGRLLAGDERAARDGFLELPESPGGEPEPRTSERPGADPRHISRASETIDLAHPGTPDHHRDFTPKPAIDPGGGPALPVDLVNLCRKRLRALALIYLAIFAILPVWRLFVGREIGRTVWALNALAVVSLGAFLALLSRRRPLSPTRLRALELGMVGVIACVVAMIYHHAILRYSLRGDVASAQLAMKNFVLYAAILILTFGLATPKRWPRAALIVGPLALLPFATLLSICLGHPGAMEGLARWTTPLAQHSFDALLLLILAVGSAYETQAIYRLRREVAETRRLGLYRLRERIGAGGMGEVYLAEHRFLKRPCAVKLIRPEVVADPNARERFEREVQITASLPHPNIVEVYDYGRGEDGTYYYVMEYLPGLSLEVLVERHGPVPPGRAVYLLRQVCRALRAAHSAGLIHRDIKPSNIIAARSSGMDDLAKLLDFGLVLPPAGSSTPSLTREGQVLGTPLFMSPEQVTSGGREVDGRSDLYGLGAVAYYLLTGRPPFEGGGGLAVLVAHARDPVVPPSRVRHGIPEDLERVVLRCLAKDPAERFQDAESLDRALGECACAEDWDEERATRWWRDADRSTASAGDRELTQSRWEASEHRARLSAS
jgi:eukaryotic-like serine/threonine-protein kinase